MLSPAAVNLPARPRAAKLPQVWLALLFVLFAAVWFSSLGTRSLVHTDEGRYSALALEMAHSGDLITPRLNGLLYFEKPALQYWMGALSFRLFGVTEFSARLWSGLAGFLTVLAVGLTAGRLWGRAAGVQALAICGSTTWIVCASHVLTLDAGLTLFLTLNLCAVLLAECAELSPSARRRWIWFAWSSMAGAVLSKGLVGVVIPGCTLLAVSLWRRDFELLRRMRSVPGSLIFLTIAAPWFLLVSVRNPGFVEFFFVHEHFTRYLTTVHHHVGPWWYYVPLLLAGLLPWTSGLPWILRREKSAAAISEPETVRVLVAWSAFVLAFFSLAGSKLPFYIVPMFPALAMLLARQLREVDAGVLRWHLLAPTLLWITVLLASTQTSRIASNDTPLAVIVALGSGFRIGALMFLAGASMAWWCLGRRHVTAAVLSVALGHFAATTTAIQAYDAYGKLKSAAPIAKVVLPLIDEKTPVFAVRAYDQTLPFYLRRNVVLVEFVDEFAFGQQREPEKSIGTLDEFITRWRSLPQGAAYMRRDTWVELSGRGVPMRVVFEDPRRLVVMKP
jgi:Aminoarabinose transferase C-terminal domain/Dolichyl-phosphate-mannose-protein mannosyltransferase